ncbi:MAG TPA: MBL fold metallo-hydrolase [Candidatus Binatia bacterium]|nr:MBL fold metallo-hydrolase [Candidatus Binatia bacterium]
MDLQFFGANCISLTTKQARLVIDDNLEDLGGKSVTREGDVVLFTGIHSKPVKSPKIVIDQPGEYEVQGIFIYGIKARGHMDETDKKTSTMYKIMNDDLNVLVTGHIYPEFSDSQLEAIGMIDVMILPVGGNGYTLDSTGALALIKKVEPKLVIPTYYDDKALKYPVQVVSLDEALKNLPMERRETAPKLRLKSSDLGEVTQLLVVEKS